MNQVGENKLIALTHSVSPNIHDHEVTWLVRNPLDVDKANEQHRQYREALESMGATILHLRGNEDYPDAVFTEDPAIVTDEVAIINRLGAHSRRGEAQYIEEALKPYRENIVHMLPEATCDGGDVMLKGKEVYVGQSTRTNREGFEFIRDTLTPYGYTVKAVEVYTGCLHLITGATTLDDETILAVPEWVDVSQFAGYKIVSPPKGEEWATNIISLDGKVLLSKGYPRTAELLDGLGYELVMVDNSELEKAEGSLTCLSILFRG